MFFQGLKQKLLDLAFVWTVLEFGIGVNRLQCQFLNHKVLFYLFHRPFAATDSFELLIIASKVQITLGQDLFDLIEQPNDMIGEFDIESPLIDSSSSLATRLWALETHLVHLGVSITFEPKPRAFVQENLAVVANVLCQLGSIQDASLIHKQGINHVWVVIHAKLEVFYDGIDLHVILFLTILLIYVMLLKLIKTLDLCAKTRDFAC